MIRYPRCIAVLLNQTPGWIIRLPKDVRFEHIRVLPFDPKEEIARLERQIAGIPE